MGAEFDIVEFRQMCGWWAEAKGGSREESEAEAVIATLAADAADEIDRLRAEVTNLQAEVKSLRDETKRASDAATPESASPGLMEKHLGRRMRLKQFSLAGRLRHFAELYERQHLGTAPQARPLSPLDTAVLLFEAALVLDQLPASKIEEARATVAARLEPRMELWLADFNMPRLNPLNPYSSARGSRPVETDRAHVNGLDWQDSWGIYVKFCCDWIKRQVAQWEAEGLVPNRPMLALGTCVPGTTSSNDAGDCSTPGAARSPLRLCVDGVPDGWREVPAPDFTSPAELLRLGGGPLITADERARGGSADFDPDWDLE